LFFGKSKERRVFFLNEASGQVYKNCDRVRCVSSDENTFIVYFTISMNIQYYGDFCFKISTKPAGRATDDIVIWTDPLQKGSGLRSPQGQVDVVFLSHSDREEIQEMFKAETVVLDTPGEYAVKGISALGFRTFADAVNGVEKGQNTVFAFESEDIHLCYLGSLGHDLTPEVLEKLNDIDILFIPIGGSDTLDVKKAVDLVHKIEPRVVIPMHYKIAGLTLPLETEKAFCEALGNCPAGSVSKLNIKKKDIEEKKMEIILLERGV